MEHLGAMLSVAQNLFDALQNSELKELCSVWGYESEIKKLQDTVNTIKAVLQDAESKSEHENLSHQVQHWVDELKDALYDADDLVDEFVTRAQITKQIRVGDTIFTKVRRMFSFENTLLVARRMYRGVKDIRDKLDQIAHNHNQFGFKLDSQPIRRRRLETCSYVDAQDIIGREEDVEKIVRTLLDPVVGQQQVPCLSIWGIGGLGKTAIAQLLYNHPSIVEHFPVRLWTCVSDQDQKSLDVKAALCKILSATPRGGNHEHSSMQQVQGKIQEELSGKKYFLILDDVWNENSLQWKEFAKFLKSGLQGSWIVVTTRSHKTATIVGAEHTYELRGLSEEGSWHLFEMTAFGQRHEHPHPSYFVEIGREIVKKCANVPLAIKVVGSLLYGQGKEKWQSFQKIGLGRVKQGDDDGIEPILKFSYHQLESPLKICFAYCALFPKDRVIEKEELINLWIAQNYIIPLHEDQSLEDASEEYFSILLKRCFFQDIKKDAYGNIISCKIHDLLHDIAQEVGGRENCATHGFRTKLDDRTRHLYCHPRQSDAENSFTANKIRTFLYLGYHAWEQISVDRLLKNWGCLRALKLRGLQIKSFPLELGSLTHLRYLDISYNQKVNLLPDSLTKLHNLQSLILICLPIKSLPSNLGNLIHLRYLDLSWSRYLQVLPESLTKLQNLRTLKLKSCDGLKELPKDMSILNLRVFVKD